MVRKALARLVGSKIPTLSEKECVILELLVLHPELYGLEIVERSNGEVGRGTVYVTLNRMAEKGYVTSRQEFQPPNSVALPRRLYRITGAGRAALEHLQRVAAMLEGALRS